MSSSHPILKGTLILTATGVFGRFVGFFYRIFLFRTIGSEGMGIYQLVFPVYALAFSFSVSGIQTAISRMVSARTAQKDFRGSRRVLRVGLSLAVGLSLLLSLLLILFHEPLAEIYMKEPRTAPLLLILAFALPTGSIHACIEAYYFGQKQTRIPAILQLTEQGLRLLLLPCLSLGSSFLGFEITPSSAMWILVIQECCSTGLSCVFLVRQTRNANSPSDQRNPARFTSKLKCSRKTGSFESKAPVGTSHGLNLERPVEKYGQAEDHRQIILSTFRELLSFSVPLTANRVLVSVLQSIEALLLPICLQSSGQSSSQALSIYGILTGMAMPLVLFPTAITSSLSTMLLPSISEAQTQKNQERVRLLVQKSSRSCLLLGLGCWLGLQLCGEPIAQLLFDTPTAGSLTRSLSLVCPFLYLAPSLTAILNGLGQTRAVFVHSLTGILIRIGFTVAAVPTLGIGGYFLGLLTSQLVQCLLAKRAIRELV